MTPALKTMLATWLLPIAVCLSIIIGWTVPRWEHYVSLQHLTHSLAAQQHCVSATPHNLPNQATKALLQANIASFSTSNQQRPLFLSPRWDTASSNGLPKWSMQATLSAEYLAAAASTTLQLSPVLAIHSIAVKPRISGSIANQTANDALYRLSITTAAP